MKELKGRDILWKLEYTTALGWFGECLLEKRYFSKEIAAACRKRLKRERAREKRLEKSQAFDTALKLLDDTMARMLKDKATDSTELVKVIVEINKDVDVEGKAYRMLMSGYIAG